MNSPLELDRQQLLLILFEEWSSNGGHFSSPDSDLWFRERFLNWGETAGEGFKRLLKTNN